MSRLDSAIRRLTFQKIALEWAARKVARMNGIILELGLGNGRTYDHLRETLPNRDIYVFERKIAAHPDCIPEEKFQFLGDFRDSLPIANKKLGANSILAHLDIGTGEKKASQQLAEQIGPLVLSLMKRGSIIVSDQELISCSHIRIDPPLNIPKGRTFIYNLA